MKKISFKKFNNDMQGNELKTPSLRFHFSIQRRFTWDHYLSNSTELTTFLKEIFTQDDEHEIEVFLEDAIEEQRPRFHKREELILFVLSIPTMNIINQKDFLSQITFFIINDRLVTVSNEDSLIESIHLKLIKEKENLESFSDLIDTILIALVDACILSLEQLDKWITKVQLLQSSSRLSSRSLKKIIELKGKLFEASRVLKADAEVALELLQEGAQVINQDVLGEYPHDRFLYGLDLIEAFREDLGNIINLQLSLDSQYLNEHLYNITILGSLFVVPSIISGIFGMNVDLPSVSFWEVMIIMIILTAATYFIMYLIKPDYLKREIEL